MSSNSNDKTSIAGFAATINSRLGAEARVAKAKAFGWCCAGAGIALSLTAIGIAFGFWGYSSLVSLRPAADQIAKSLVQALQNTNLKTEISGMVALAPGSEISLAPKQIIAIQEDTIVKLDPNSSVRVIGDLKIEIPQPSQKQLQLDNTSKSNELPLTNYTVFRSVSYEKGMVVTGWKYDLSDTSRPQGQHCYYTQGLEKGMAAKYALALNGKSQRPSPLAKLSFNFDGAVANCIWFSGS